MQHRPSTLPRRATLRRLGAVALFAFACLTAWRTPAQVNILTSPSQLSLQNALNAGGTVELQFTGIIYVTSPLVISVDNTILDATGFSVIIDGSNTTRVFDVAANIHFGITNVTIAGANNIGRNGTAGLTGGAGNPKGNAGGSGGTGANGLGGGLYNQGFTVMVDCVLTNDLATGGNGGSGGDGGNGANNGFGTGGNGGNGGNGGVGYGGGVYNLGTILLSNCTFSANSVIGGIGGIGGTNGSGTFASYPGSSGAGGAGSGAGLYNLGTATIANCTFNQDSATGETGPGGGPPQSGGDNGTQGPNGGNSLGGGVCNLGTLTVINSTFNQNSVTGGTGETGGTGDPSFGVGGAGGSGGNAYGGSLYSQGTVNITNCTFANGAATGGAGGAPGSGAFTGNNGSSGASEGANIASGGGTFNFKNSILAYPENGVNAYGTISDQGNNISSDGTFTFTTTNSFNNLDPLLASLNFNGGQTPTMQLLPGSPAIDAIYDNSAPPTDQRGAPRPFGPRSDIGAYEYGASMSNLSISGTVLISGQPFPGVSVNVGNTSVNTDTNGKYSVFVAAGLNYSIVPQPVGYFSPNSTSVTLMANTANVNFAATNNPTTAAFVTNSHSTLQLSFSTVPTFTYRIQAATNLVSTNGSATNWVDIATNTATGNVILFTNVISTNFPRRFFRAVTP